MNPIQIDEKLLEEVHKKLDEDARRAVKCWCGGRADPPFGNGTECLVCMSRPGAEVWQMILR